VRMIGRMIAPSAGMMLPGALYHGERLRTLRFLMPTTAGSHY